MGQISGLVVSAALMVGLSMPAEAGRRGSGDGSITDRSRVKTHQRYLGDNAKRGPDRDYRYREKCYWYFKNTDGWWPTGATQKCIRIRVE